MQRGINVRELLMISKRHEVGKRKQLELFRRDNPIKTKHPKKREATTQILWRFVSFVNLNALVCLYSFKFINKHCFFFIWFLLER